MDTTTRHLYFGARKTCLEMLTDRGYVIPPTLHTVLFQDFNEEHLELVDIYDKDNNRVFIKMFREFMKPADIKAAFKDSLQNAMGITIQSDLEELTPDDKLHAIIIYDPSLGTSPTSYKFETEHVGHPFIEVFDVHKLYINPTKHVYQAKWRLMKEKEITDLLKRYEAQMPQTTRVILGSICIDDPINRYYFGKPPSKNYRGDVYEIIRDGISIFYRKVVNKKMNIKTERNK